MKKLFLILLLAMPLVSQADVVTGPTTVTLLSVLTVVDDAINPIQYIVTLKLQNGNYTSTPYANYMDAASYPDLKTAIESYGASETINFENYIRSVKVPVRTTVSVDIKTIPLDPSKIKT